MVLLYFIAVDFEFLFMFLKGAIPTLAKVRLANTKFGQILFFEVGREGGGVERRRVWGLGGRVGACLGRLGAVRVGSSPRPRRVRWRSEGWDLRRVGPPKGGAEGWRAQNLALFFSLSGPLFFFSPFGCTRGQMCTCGVLGQSCETPAASGREREKKEILGGAAEGGVWGKGGLAEGGEGLQKRRATPEFVFAGASGGPGGGWPGLGRSGSVGGGWNGTIRGTASAQASVAQIVLVKLCLTKVCFGRTWFWPNFVWPNLVTSFGQSWCWPNVVWPNLPVPIEIRDTLLDVAYHDFVVFHHRSSGLA